MNLTGKELFEMAKAAEITAPQFDFLRWENLPESIRETCDAIAGTMTPVKVRPEAVTIIDP